MNIKLKSPKSSLLKSALVLTVPVMTGYLSVGFAFGLLVVSAGYPWYLVPLMSVFIYAGAAQFLAISFFVNSAGMADMVITIFLLNARHMVYGLSMLGRYSGASFMKPYLVFSLTDETYALLTSAKVPGGVNEKAFYFTVSLLDQVYWIAGGIFGALFGNMVAFNTKGLDFALAALFTVLLVEQFRSAASRIPFVIALVCGTAAFFISKQYMLLISISASIVTLSFFRGRMERHENA